MSRSRPAERRSARQQEIRAIYKSLSPEIQSLYGRRAREILAAGG
ncbi:MAG: hypothetical protein OXH69_19005 [Acidobacteria bacterium]|nr:hypothetical protein [Acidobacteriota bacterium]